LHNILLSRRIRFVFLLLFTSKELQLDNWARSDVAGCNGIHTCKNKNTQKRKQHNNSWSNEYHRNTRLSLMRTLW